MEVTSVKKYKGSTYEVELDDGRKIYLHIDIIADYGLRSGMQLERDELRKIIYSSNFRRAYQYALYCLDHRDYSAKEMTKKLIGTYKNERLCTDVVKKLTDNTLIDDERYAEKLARRMVEIKKYGFRRALREITLKGIDKFTAEDALAPYSGTYAENLMHLLNTKHYRYLTDIEDRKSVEKVKSALVRYGYGFDEINRAVKEYFENAGLSEE
ncbi:MAG: RecX family transcriptional regulator [Ruminococcus sp.]|nr:RecX family transcriptional regulator [Ruminococcus sp.]